MAELTHINEQGRAKMVDVSEKADTKRIGIASGRICMQPETFTLITDGKIKKGDVLAVAQVAGIMAAKKTWEIIPMCHPLLLTGVDIHFELIRKYRRSKPLLPCEPPERPESRWKHCMQSPRHC